MEGGYPYVSLSRNECDYYKDREDAVESTAVYQGKVYVGMEKLFFDFLQVAVGNRKSLSIGISDADWHRIFEFCKKQALIGVGFTAVEKLHAMGGGMSCCAQDAVDGIGFAD